MRKEAEPWSFPQRGFDLIDQAARHIEPDDEALAAWFSKYRQQHRARLVADLDILQRRVSPPAYVLEYGAVPLLLTAALAELGYRVSALDIAPARFSSAIDRLGLDVREVDVERETVPFDAATFDAVLFNEIFEHLRIDPIFTLREALRVLKPGGLLLLSTPNLRSLRGLRNLVLRNQGHAASASIYDQYEKLATIGHMGHVREYTTTEVAEFLTRVGFTVETIIYRGGHGSGVVGAVERLAPSMRPFFTVLARRGRDEAGSRPGGDGDAGAPPAGEER